jgi:hypothetical protein
LFSFPLAFFSFFLFFSETCLGVICGYICEGKKMGRNANTFPLPPPHPTSHSLITLISYSLASRSLALPPSLSSPPPSTSPPPTLLPSLSFPLPRHYLTYTQNSCKDQIYLLECECQTEVSKKKGNLKIRNRMPIGGRNKKKNVNANGVSDSPLST